MNTILKCLEVFFARVLDVSIGSVRTIMLVKGKNIIACFLAFIEILVWFYVAQDILTNQDVSLVIVLCYAGGYAIGTYIGGIINKLFVRGNLTAFIVTDITNKRITDVLKEKNYGVTTISEIDGKITLLVEFKKKNLKKLKSTIQNVDKSAFIVVNESLHVENGYLF